MKRSIARAGGLPLLVLLLLGFVAACATTGEGGPRSDPDELTSEELLSVQVNNVYDAVQRLRPQWLDKERQSDNRSFNLQSGIVVYHHQTFLGDVDVLRQWSTEAVRQLVWLDGSQASATLPGLGSRHVAGAIVIETRAR